MVFSYLCVYIKHDNVNIVYICRFTPMLLRVTAEVIHVSQFFDHYALIVRYAVYRTKKNIQILFPKANTN